jgi:YD repeat-containing protein
MKRNMPDKNGDYEYEYDANGHRTHSMCSDGSEEWYDAGGNVIRAIDSAGYEYLYEYENGKLVHEKSDTGCEAFYEYDAAGNLIHARGSDRSEWLGEYDVHGNLTYEKTYPYTEHWYTYTYQEINGKSVVVKKVSR